MHLLQFTKTFYWWLLSFIILTDSVAKSSDTSYKKYLIKSVNCACLCVFIWNKKREELKWCQKANENKSLEYYGMFYDYLGPMFWLMYYILQFKWYFSQIVCNQKASYINESGEKSIDFKKSTYVCSSV